MADLDDDENQDMDFGELEEENIEDNDEILLEGEDEDFENEEEFDKVDLNSLSPKQYVALMKQGLLGDLPAYLFQTPKERQKFFSKLNKDYRDNLEKEKNLPDKTHKKHVKFNISKSQIFGKLINLLNN